ncbi:MAG: DUF11 domain-containing protein [Methanoregulaceae archaeon]|nr:MAG: DUF11 domain-containing protein [Methanoregulaceae archaeon]
MQKWKFYGFIAALACVMIFAPVAACHVQLLTKTGPDVVCPTCEYYEYTITAASSDPVAMLRVVDTLPAGLSFVSASPAPSTIVGQTLTWYFGDPGTSTQTITVRVKPLITTNPVSNFVSAAVKPYGGSYTGAADTSRNPVITQFDVNECPIPSPEFPSIALPVGMIIGVLGVVLRIQKTREH